MAGSIWALDSPTDLFWILVLLPFILYGASRILLPGTWRAAITLPRVSVGLASVVNVALVYMAVVTVYHAHTGRLRAQEDFGTFMLILLAGTACVLVCLVAALISAAVKYRGGRLSAAVLKTPTFLLGLTNCLAPAILALAFLWLVRR